MSCCNSCAKHKNQSAKLGRLPFECLSDPTFSGCAGGGFTNIERGLNQDFIGYHTNDNNSYIRGPITTPDLFGMPKTLSDKDEITDIQTAINSAQASPNSASSLVVPALLALGVLLFLKR